jgi:PAS domain S-box-containing protein
MFRALFSDKHSVSEFGRFPGLWNRIGVCGGVMQTKEEDIGILAELHGRETFGALLGRMIECVDEACFALDAAGAVIAWNHAMEMLTGISARDMLGRSDRECARAIAGNDVSLLVEHVLKNRRRENIPAGSSRQGNGILEREESFPGRFGNRTFRTRAAVFHDPGGSVLGAIQSFHEITRPDASNGAETTDREKYQTFVETAADFFFIHDLDGNLLETNFSSKIPTAYVTEDILHKNIRDFLPVSFREGFGRYLDEILTQGGGEGIIRLVTGDGNERVIEYRNTLVRDAEGRPLYVQGAGRDVTDKIKGRRALKISEERYRSILESIEEGYFEVDLAGNLTFFNRVLVRSLKYPESELRGMNYRRYMDEENAVKVFDVFHQVYVTGAAVKALELEIRDRNGSPIIIEASVSLLRDQAKAPVGFHGIVRDITLRKEMEKERDRYEQRLSRAQKMEAIGTLASGIAHDFNNMLSAIMGYAELAKTQLTEGTPAHKSIGGVMKAGEKAQALAARLLSIGRKYRSDLAAREAVDVGYVIREALSLMKATIPSTIEIRTALSPDAGQVYADPMEIHQLVMNLCTNAYQAMEAEGGILQVTLEPVSLTGDKSTEQIQPALNGGDYLRLSVSDTGCGMDEDTRERIFEPFFTTKEPGKGTGLGLTTVKRIIADLKGGISIASTPGKGSIFALYLPRYNGSGK